MITYFYSKLPIKMLFIPTNIDFLLLFSNEISIILSLDAFYSFFEPTSFIRTL